jgi:tRNA threonylcarbamoyladenosine biosynthesis protein TsaB
VPLLCINTCEQACEVLLRVDDQDHWQRREMPSGQDRVLAQMVQDILQETRVRAEDLSRIAIAVGPGSFTGVRIGVSFARGLALCGSAELVGIHLLDVMAQAIHAQTGSIGVAVRNVGRGQVAWSAWDDAGQMQDISVCDPQTLPAALKTLTKGSRWQLCGDSVPECPTPHRIKNPMTGFADFSSKTNPGANPAHPWYARPPDAKLPGGIDPWA